MARFRKLLRTCGSVPCQLVPGVSKAWVQNLFVCSLYGIELGRCIGIVPLLVWMLCQGKFSICLQTDRLVNICIPHFCCRTRRRRLRECTERGHPGGKELGAYAFLISASVTSEPLSSSKILYGSSASFQPSMVETDLPKNQMSDGWTSVPLPCKATWTAILMSRHSGILCIPLPCPTAVYWGKTSGATRTVSLGWWAASCSYP